VLLSEGALQNSILLIPAAMSLATGVAFVTLAYRVPGGNSGTGRVGSQTTADNGDRHSNA